jgi:ABC transporter substrate binding protein (PQQ-dependent alcohol dehydrogenase system)
MLGRAGISPAHADGDTATTSTPEVLIGWLGQQHDAPPTLANVPPPPQDQGLQGARLGLADTATTGKFLKQRYRLIEITLGIDQDPSEAMAAFAHQGVHLLLSGLDAPTLRQAMATPQAADMLVFNTMAADDSLRGADCAAHLLHTLPSRAMRADALAQTLIQKRWRRWFLITGPTPQDALFSAAIRRAAQRFGGKIVEDKAWSGQGDLRRSAQTELVAFTQGDDYDVVIVADEANDFGDYLPYNTALPRPVVGTQGLVATAWHWSLENWGAGQLQNRFQEQTGRPMLASDWAAWVAVRAIGEAATRGHSTTTADIISMLGDENFSVAGFKGRPLSFRPWDGQLRQPLLLVWPRALVSLAPQEGFLHPTNDLDTLGMDRPESTCNKRH